MKSMQGFSSRVTNLFVGRREDVKESLPQQPDYSQVQKPQLKKLNSDNAFRNPNGSPSSTPSSNTEYVDKPAIVNKLEDGEMKLQLPPPKQ
jgi:hypothetical protein